MDNVFIEHLKEINYKGVVQEYVVTKILDKGLKKLKNIFSAHLVAVENYKFENSKDDYATFLKNYELSISEDVLVRNVINNLHVSNTWSNEINFNLSKQSKALEKIFVDIDLYLSPLRNRFSVDEEVDTVKSSTISKYLKQNILIYGGPGAGKTTLMKNICKTFLSTRTNNDFTCPIVIRFRELDYNQLSNNYGKELNLYRILLQVFGIIIKFPDEKATKLYNENSQLVKLTVLEFLEHSKLLLLFDGFDEIPNQDLKQIIERDFQTLALSIKESRFILTSRNGDFRLNLENCHTFEICPLRDDQILKLTSKWLNNKQQAMDLYTKIKASPYYDTTLRPLTLSHLCAIYERRKSIPPKPRYVYDLVIQLLLEKWDEERGIVRPSMYADFYIEKKKEFLAHLSFCLTHDFNATVFSGDTIRLCYNKIYKSHNLPASQAKKVVNEIESHSGIIIQNGFDAFQFSHKSLQEYLTAKYLFSLPAVPDLEISKRLPNELAIAISLSGSPNTYFSTFIKRKNSFNEGFWEVFIPRLIDERPDFTEDPCVVVFFLIMIKEKSRTFYVESLKQLIKLTNLKISFPQFFKNYRSSAEFSDSIKYEHVSLSSPLDHRNYLPGHLIIDKSVLSMITES